ncbi:unnamed protein product [Mytilus edulis]|uniref:Uncharacterized protein n=1 Tax=Mytilus edulis TaxID=6550 RepID=A0A8S3VAS3_MYTED|nr:unnamed protein product [Mytilus edulis]
MSGKKLISKFLTKQLKYVDLKNNLIVDIDSEAYLSECECQNDDHCQWDLYATPASTRLKKRKRKITIAHLKEENKIVKENFSKQAAVSTMSGKKLISKFLTKQLKYVDLKNNLIVDIDSEAYLSECECQNDDHCHDLNSVYELVMECINNPTLKRLHSGRTVFLKQYPTPLGYAKDGTQYSVLKVVVETRRV